MSSTHPIATMAPSPARSAHHAFDNTRPEFHHPEASALAWQRTLAFLRRHLD